MTKKRLFKKWNNLYNYFLISFIVSAFLSLCIWQIASRIYENNISDQYEQEKQEKTQLYNEKSKQLIAYIEDNNLSSDAVVRGRIEKYLHSLDYFILAPNGGTFNNKDDLRDGLEDFFDTGTLMYPVQFSDGYGLIVIKADFKSLKTNVYRTLIAFFSIFIFLLLTLLLVGRKVKYIREINRGIDIIGGGSLSHNIPIRDQDELSQLAHSINTMSDSLRNSIALEKLGEQKQRTLITNLSHDLRTPLTSIIGYINILCDGKYDNEDELNNYIYLVKEKSLRLQVLLDNLFAYTKLTNGDIPCHKSKINLNTFTKQYIEHVDLNVVVNQDQAVSKTEVDVEWLTRIYDNIFDNISKYGVLQQPINIYLTHHEKGVRICFENETNEDLSHKVDFLFDRMYVGKEDRSHKSSGLGLAIVNEYMKQMNGKASCEFKEPLFRIILWFPSCED